MIHIIAWSIAALAGGIAIFLFARLNAVKAKVAELQQLQARAIAAESQLAASQAVLERAEADICQLKEQAETLQQELTALSTTEAVAHERLTQAEETEKRMKADREDLQQKFENLANQIFEQKQNANKASMQQVLEPLKQQIETFRARIDEVHTADTNQSGALKNALEQLHTLNTQLQKEAESLARALKNEPQTRGRWGEVILERTMEIAGLVKGRDYRTQVTEGSSRLDAVVYLPGERCVVVDSKVPLNDYTSYCDALNDEEREKSLKAHIDAVRGFVDDLSRKDYSALLDGKAPDFTIMLIPVEPAFAAAFKADGTLMEYALERRIIPTSTASLVATLRVIENLWKIDAQNKNVKDIADEGAKLLQYIDIFVTEQNEVGVALSKAKEIHDKAVQRLTAGGKGSITGTANRLKDLGVRMTTPKTGKIKQAASSQTNPSLENDGGGESSGIAADEADQSKESEGQQTPTSLEPMADVKVAG